MFAIRRGELPRTSQVHQELLRSKLCLKKRFNFSMALKSVEWKFKKKSKERDKIEFWRNTVKLSSGLDTKVRRKKTSNHFQFLAFNFYTDAIIEMDTLRTQRARKLSEMFKQLRHPSGNIDERLHLLNEISESLADESSSRIIDLENLFQRERELLMCQVADESLEVLRQRELVVFMDVIKDEENNKPESEDDQQLLKYKMG
jgi:hypothetical protein